MAIGDGMNDYEMLMNAGFAIAMANAKQPLIDLADHVTDDNDNHGVARALKRFILEG
jgi:5-amino-6-(5-phospho-D-ribitylamino)uracil phosphatase